VLQISNHVENELNNEPQAGASTDGSSKNYNRELREKLRNEYPVRYVLLNSILTAIISVFMIGCERTQTNRFEFNDILIISYRSLNGLVLLGSALSLFYSFLAILTGN
jgi:hypothetical protein